MNRYTFRAQWCPEQDEYIGLCVELPYLRERAPLPDQAVALAAAAVDEHVESLRACGETPPQSLTERNYSGTFVVRTSPALHARMAMEAVEQRVSMNQWVVQQLSGRGAGGGFGSLFD